MTERRIKVVVDPSGAEAGSRRVNNAMESMGRSAGSLGRTFAGLGVAIVGALSFEALVRRTIEVNREFGKFDAMLKTVTGSARAAGQAFDQLERFAATTPFTLDQSVKAFVRLKALGLDPSERALRSYGNTAAAMGKNLIQFVDAVADATTGEFERLKEFGIRAKTEGDRIRFTFQGVTTEVGNSSKEIEGFLRSIGEEKFGDAMSNQKKTLEGAISNLQDSFDGLLRTIGEVGATNAIQNFVNDATSALQSLQRQIAGTARIYRESGLFGVLGSSRAELEGAATAGGRRGQLEAEVARQAAELRRIQGNASAGGARGFFGGSRFAQDRARNQLLEAQRRLAAFSLRNQDELVAGSAGASLALPGLGGGSVGGGGGGGGGGSSFEAAGIRRNAALRADALRKEERALERLQRFADSLLEVSQRLSDEIGTGASAFDDGVGRLRDRLTKRQPFDFAGDFDRLETRVGELLKDAGYGSGEEVARGFRSAGAEAAEALGLIIGGSAGRQMQRFAGVFQGLASGDFTGVGGQAGGILTLLSQRSGKKGPGALSEGIRDAFRQPVKSFKETGDLLQGAFKSGGGLEKVLGKAAGGAATGAAVAGLGNLVGIKMNSAGAQIGGAIGSFIPIPGGEIIGSIAGGLLGNIGPKARAYSNLSVDSAGNIIISSGGARGTKQGANKAAAAEAAGGVSMGLSSILEAVGGSLRPGSTIGTIGPVGSQFGFATSGAVGGSNKSLIKFETAEQAAEALIKSVFERGLVQGIDSFTQRVLSSSKSLDAATDVAARYKTALDLIAEREDPIGTAARNAGKQFDDLIKDMREFGATTAEISKIERLRTDAIKEALDEQLSGLRSFKELLSGEGSGETSLNRLSRALEAYDKQRAMIGQADFDQAEFTRLGQEVFGLSRDVFGTSTQQFQDIRQRLIADTAGAISTTEATFNAAAEANKPVVAAIDNQTLIAARQLEGIGQTNELLRQVIDALSESGFSGGGLAVNGALVAAR